MKRLRLFKTNAEAQAFSAPYTVVSYNEQSGKVGFVEAKPPHDEIWYTSIDGNIVVPNENNPFWAYNEDNSIVSNTYNNGKGVIKLSNSATRLSTYAFKDCITLKTLVLPNSITLFELAICWGCSNLESIFIPDSVTNMRNDMFVNCTSLKSIVIPPLITWVSDSVFSGCTALESIVLPSSITYLGESAFWNCNSLKSFVCKAVVPPNLDFDTLSMASDCIIYVPAASVDAYKAKSGWSDRAAYIQAIPE